MPMLSVVLPMLSMYHYTVCNVITGINSAAMFQECLLVLRTIVLQSLGIDKGTSGQSNESARRTVEQIRQATNQESPIVQSTSPPTEKGAGSTITSESRPMNVAPRDKKSNSFTTPSPHSRISSGFGSLHDEDGSISHGSTTGPLRQANQTNHITDESSPRDSHVLDIEAGSQEHRQKRRHRRHKPRRHVQREAPPSDMNTDITNGKRRTVRESVDNDSIPPPPIGAWTSPDASVPNRTGKSGDEGHTHSREQSIEHHNDWSLQSTPPVVANPFNSQNRALTSTVGSEGVSVMEKDVYIVSPKKKELLSPRAERRRKKLESKQDDLRRSREEKRRLATEVNLLDLKVQEEGTK